MAELAHFQENGLHTIQLIVNNKPVSSLRGTAESYEDALDNFIVRFRSLLNKLNEFNMKLNLYEIGLLKPIEKSEIS